MDSDEKNEHNSKTVKRNKIIRQIRETLNIKQ